MAQVKVSNLTFAYEGSFDNIFEDVSFSVDTNLLIFCKCFFIIFDFYRYFSITNKISKY